VKVRLSSLCNSIVDCEHKTAPSVAAGFPCIGTRDIKNGRINLVDAKKVSPETYTSWTSRIEPLPGDLIMAREAPVGEVGRIPPGAQVCLGQRTVLLRPDSQCVHGRYLHYVLLNPMVQARLRSLSEGSTTPHLNVSDIRRFEVDIIEDSSQQAAIANTLGVIDDKIELNRRITGTVLQLGVAIFANCSGQDRAVSTLCRIARSTVRPMDYPDQTFSHFSLPAFDRAEGPTLEPGRSVLSHKFQVTGDCILLSRLNPDIPRVWLPNVDPDLTAIASTEWLVLVPIGPWRHALFAALNRPEFFEAFSSMATGTTGSHQRVSAADLLGMPVRWPEDGRLSELEPQLKLLFDLMATFNRQNRTLAQMRDQLLPKMMSGEIRLKEADKAAAEAL
jgi:type I restriction enzyme, S subunit